MAHCAYVDGPSPSMETLSEAITRLRGDGYSQDWVAVDGISLQSLSTGRRYSPFEFSVDETVRFEGVSGPGAGAVLFALSGPGQSGLYIAAQGRDASAAQRAVTQRLGVEPSAREIQSFEPGTRTVGAAWDSLEKRYGRSEASRRWWSTFGAIDAPET